MAIVILNQGSSQQLPGVRFDQENGADGSSGVLSAYRSHGVEFGIMQGDNGGLGKSLYARADDMVDGTDDIDYKPVYDPDVHDWLSVNFENFAQVQIMHRGIASGSDSDAVIPASYWYLKRSDGTNLDPKQMEQIGKTVADYKEEPYDPAAPVTWREAYDALIDAHDYAAVRIRSTYPQAKVNQWWKHGSNIISLGGNGWYLHPPELGENGSVVFGTTKARSAVAGANLLDGTQCFRTTNGDMSPLEDAVAGKDAAQWGDSSEYPIGSFDARSRAQSFERASACHLLKRHAGSVSAQTYTPYSGRSLSDFPHAPSHSTGLDLVCASPGRYVTREQMRAAMYQQVRRAWLASVLHHGRMAAIGTELCLDAFIPGIPDIGGATPHGDYIELRVKPCLDPVTPEEVALYGLPGYWDGLILAPHHWTFWNATYYYLTSQIFEEHPRLSNEDRANARANIEHRFGGSGAPTPEWSVGSPWHQHVCEGLDEFGVERCRRVKQALDEARLKGAARRSTLVELGGIEPGPIG